MKVINQDITTIETGIIGHQCNCRGVMGGGVALAIQHKWPKTYKDYMTAYKEGKLVLGNVIPSMVSTIEEDPLIVMHLCGQFHYGRSTVYTNYDALEKALIEMKRLQCLYSEAYGSRLPIYLPYGIGCGLAGGEWRIVEPIIEKIIPDVILCKFGGK